MPKETCSIYSILVSS